MFCDFVGGLVATSLELGASAEAAEPAASFVLASTAKEQEETELALAVYVQAQETAEGAESVVAHEQIMAMEEEAGVKAAEVA